MGLALNFHKIVLLLCLAAAAAPAVSGDKLENFSLSFPSFGDKDTALLKIRDAQISNRALQVTPDSYNIEIVNPYNRYGRVLFNQPFKLWADSSSNSSIASFNISFLINIYNRRNDSAAGDGLAFVIAPDLGIPGDSSGQYLGLTNSTTDGNATNHLVAVELDTFKDEFDPDANHVGLNINSVKSVKNESLTPHGIVLVPDGDPPRFHVVWVQYNGTAKEIKVYVARQAEKDGPTPPRPDEPMLSEPLDLRQVVKQNSYFGFSASTGKDAKQLNCVLQWNLTGEFYAEDKIPWVKIVIGAGVPILAVLVSAAAGLGYCLSKKRMAKSNSSIAGALKSLPGTPREFRFVDLKKATNNFEEKNKLGQGGFGVVYKGHLQKENLEVAVKCFSRESIKGQGDFLAELTIINLLRHKHLVRLLGWCHKNGKLLLVYEYMPNGSLDKHLFGGANRESLSWGVRYKIISGVASALHYLHNEYNQRVLHRDLKASNIMLDSDFGARLGDFGLARALDNEKTSYAEAEGMPGTLGYIAPECILTGKATRQSDVYAFGAVLLEVVCGLRPGTKIGAFQVLIDWVWSLHREGRLLDAVDERIAKKDLVEDEAHRILLLGLACSHPIASERPTTHEIVQMISGSVPVPFVPPFKPAFVWPSAVPSALEDISLDTASAGTKFFSTTSRIASGWTRECVSREGHKTTSYSDGYDLV